MAKALVVLSGGQDSTACLYWALNNSFYTEVHAVTFNYGQRHRAEIEAAKTIAKMAGVASHEVVTLGSVLKGTSPLVNNSFNVEKYKDAASLPGGLEKTFVPGRNTLFLTLAANRAYVLGVNHIITGVSQEDYGGYPDCRQDFILSMEDTLNRGLRMGDDDPFKLTIKTPLIQLTKKQTVELAKNLGIGAWDATGFSHTCYEGGVPSKLLPEITVPCGKCHACLLREKGFAEAGFEDPLVTRLKLMGAM